MFTDENDDRARFDEEPGDQSRDEAETQRPEPPEAPTVVDGYESLRARAEIREGVRIFVDRIKEMWESPARTEKAVGDNSPLYSLIRLKTLNASRFRWFSHTIRWPVIVFGALGLVYLATRSSIDAVAAQIVNADFAAVFPFVAIAFLTICAGIISAVFNYAVMDQERSNYRGGVTSLANDIEQEITDHISSQGGAAAHAQSRIRAIVSARKDEARVKGGIVETTKQWRSLERLPYYLRHEWDRCLFDVFDHWRLNHHRAPRVGLALAVAATLVVLAALTIWEILFSGRYDVLSGRAIGEVGAPLSATALFIALALNFLASGAIRLGRWIKLHRLDLITSLTLVMVVAAMYVVPGTLEGGDVFAAGLGIYGGLALSFALPFAMLVGYGSGHGYKRTAHIAAVRISIALRTHTKKDLLDMLELPMKEIFELSARDLERDGTWNGWSPKYEESLRERLVEDGLSTYEIAVRVQTDPLIYVGEESNRRLEVCRFDPTPAFLNSIPELRSSVT